MQKKLILVPWDFNQVSFIVPFPGRSKDLPRTVEFPQHTFEEGGEKWLCNSHLINEKNGVRRWCGLLNRTHQ